MSLPDSLSSDYKMVEKQVSEESRAFWHKNWIMIRRCIPISKDMVSATDSASFTEDVGICPRGISPGSTLLL